MACAKGRGRKHLGLATSGNARPNSGHREKANACSERKAPYSGASLHLRLEARDCGPLATGLLEPRRSVSYNTSSDQFSIVSFTLCRNWWPIAPSTTRWSHLTVTCHIERMAIQA